MGKARRIRRKREAQKKLALTSSGELEVTIFSSISGPDNLGIGVKEDLAAVRAALLYADKVKLYSGAAAFTAGIRQIGSLSLDRQLLFIAQHLPKETVLKSGIDPQKSSAEIRSLIEYTSQPRTFRHRNSESRKQSKEVTKRLKDAGRDWVPGLLAKQLEGWNQHGGPELDEAVESGLLEVDTDWFFKPGGRNLEVNQEALLETLLKSKAHYLAGDSMRKLAQEAHNKGILEISPFAQTQVRKTRTGTDMIARLPTFEEAPVSKILQVREETRDSLAAYRSEVAALSEKLSTPVLSDEFIAEIDQLWTDNVLFSIQKIEKDLSESSLGGSFRKTMRQAPGAIPSSLVAGGAGFGGGMMFAATHTPDLDTIFAAMVASGVTGAGYFIKNFGKDFKPAYEEALKRKDQARSDGLYYLYDVNRSLP